MRQGKVTNWLLEYTTVCPYCGDEGEGTISSTVTDFCVQDWPDKDRLDCPKCGRTFAISWRKSFSPFPKDW